MYEPTLEENLAATIKGDWILTGDEMHDAAEKWIQEHPSDWLDIKREARAFVAAGKKFSLRECIVIPLKWKNGFSCANSLTAPMSRILAKQIPGYIDYCQMNHSKVDDRKED